MRAIFIDNAEMANKDFIKWEYLPCALAPDESYDEGGCYSGSAVEVDGEHVLIYTGVMDRYLDACITPASFWWSGMMTVPRELTLEHGRIYQRPVRELEGYRTDIVDRTHSGIDRDVVCRRKMELAPMRGEDGREVVKLRILTWSNPKNKLCQNADFPV